jgi:ABC-type lipoprotein export system ATPase subunit
MYSIENRMYIKIGLVLMSLYIFTLIFVTSWMNMTFKEFTLFFIASLLTYKCINNNINELLDIYSTIRQTRIDFDSLNDIWKSTSTKRPSYNNIELPSYPILNECNDVEEYLNYRFDLIGTNQIKIYNDFFLEYKITNKFKQYCNQVNCNIKDDPRDKLLYTMKKFISSTIILTEAYKKYITNNNINIDITDEFQLYKDYQHHLNKYNPQYKISLYELYFCYPQSDEEQLYSIKYKNKKPIELYSNSSILITGQSGSGKTTLLKIIRGIIPLLNKKYDSINMNLNIYNDQLYDNISWLNLSNQICYCQQNSYSFNGGSIYQILSDDFITSSNNKDNNKCQLMDKALNIACTDYKFRDLDFICTKESVSGGQKQRLILAKNIYRLLCNDKPIVILDEVDTGIDLNTAKRIMINLDILFKNKLLIVVLHTKELMELFNNTIHISNGIIN